MPRQSKVEVDGGNKRPPSQLEPSDYAKLVEKVRKSKSDEISQQSFSVILEGMKPKILNLCRKFRIAGADQSDIYQEACFALRYKAIKDYDKTRGSVEGIAPFDRFALLCIKRHLATLVKTSRQLRQTALNTAVSLNQSAGSLQSSGDDLSLINIIPNPHQEDVLHEVGTKEYQKILFGNLMRRLSDFEKEVFILFGERNTYEEIAEIISKRRSLASPPKRKVNVKSVDNALSRIKHKAAIVYDLHGDKEATISKSINYSSLEEGED